MGPGHSIFQGTLKTFSRAMSAAHSTFALYVYKDAKFVRKSSYIIVALKSYWRYSVRF